MEAITTKPHVNLGLETALRVVREQILAMGRLVEANVGEAVRSLVERDLELANRLAGADGAVNQMELAIDEQCIRLLALYQPEASDLRFVASAVKMVTDLERIGDLAVDMTEAVRPFLGRSPLPVEAAIPGLAGEAQTLLHTALDAFVEGDAGKAERIIAAGARFERSVQRLCSDLTAEMQSVPEIIERGVALLFFAKRLKRVVAHVANVGEMVIYYVRGQDVRHARSLEQARDH